MLHEVTYEKEAQGVGGGDVVGKAVRQGVNDRISLCLRPGGAGQREKQNHQKQGMSH